MIPFYIFFKEVVENKFIVKQHNIFGVVEIVNYIVKLFGGDKGFLLLLCQVYIVSAEIIGVGTAGGQKIAENVPLDIRTGLPCVFHHDVKVFVKPVVIYSFDFFHKPFGS